MTNSIEEDRHLLELLVSKGGAFAGPHEELLHEVVGILRRIGARLEAYEPLADGQEGERFPDECADLQGVLNAGGAVLFKHAFNTAGPDGEALFDLGSPPDPDRVRLANILLCSLANGPEDFDDERLLRLRHAGPLAGPELYFGFAPDVAGDMYPPEATGVALEGPVRFSYSSSAGCWFVVGEAELVEEAARLAAHREAMS